MDRLLPDAASALGLAPCASSSAANATDADYAADADYADYSPRLTGVADAVRARMRAPATPRSATGAAIVVAAAAWTAGRAYAALTSTRWITSRAHAHYVRLRVFAAVTDPSEAAACDVPFLNLRKAAEGAPARAPPARARALERRWVALCVAHPAAAAVACALAAALAAARAHTCSPARARVDASAVAFCFLAALWRRRWQIPALARRRAPRAALGGRRRAAGA